MDDAAVTSGSERTASTTFPGGRVRLPRLSAKARAAEPEINVVESAFIRQQRTAPSDASHDQNSGFKQYFTYESLFEDIDTSAEADRVAIQRDDPYAVLRVAPGSDWHTIVVAHRALVKEFHPDRFTGHPPDVIAQADDEIKRINAAYTSLKKALGH